MTTVEATTDSAGGYPDRVFFGDTHLHTSNSMDVYLFDTPSATLDTAYRFAKGEPVTSPTTGTTWQLKTPLDFLVVADHSEMVGSIRRLYEGDPEIAETKTGKAFLGASPNTTGKELLYVYQQIALIGSGLEDESPLGITMGQLFSDLHADGKIQTAWDENIKAADMYNEPGTFTTLIGWEWSSQPAGGANLHRVIFMPQGADVASRFLPFSALDSQDPEDLWAWLDQTSAASSADFVAMPHNPNLSLGLMFPLETLSGEPVDAAYAQARMRWEPVVEMTQIKGDSETHPLLSPTDEFADYETYQFVMTPIAGTPDPKAGDYMRTGLMRGLELENEIGVNPYKTGMIGATDSHTGISAIDEDAFAGKGQKDSRPELRSNPTGIGASRGWDMGAAGFAGVWATENTRQAIFDAFKRKEVYATTGPRITVRFFGGFGLSQADASAADIAGPGYKKGVPMGRDLNRGDGAPSFLVAAMKDPNEANLDRVQIVKGWLKADGSTEERIYDVALSDGRTDGSVPVGNTVDLKTGQYSNDIGAAQLSAVWEDPDFDASQPSFYYARVLQIPTPRYSLPNAIELGIDLEETGRPATIQERAYTSPIWYSP
ncbi:MAG: DUF3604 domain-containing protein [Candidatus Thiodiazotropha sp. (ex Monitilora ramsayi)]|nr:DUF3604 domain-containing protein [Candidatus Thiodiazotropha sp. (ex Monitilora ramsayi)]